MKINVADLEPNPFRKIKSYPIDRDKVEALKISITETSFWDNILARPCNGKFQIAYGHHRWIAIKELGMKTVDIPVRELSDAFMVKIMAEENLNWATTPAVVNETVLAAKEFLDGELAKYKDWNHVNKSIKVIFVSNSQFQQCKRDGVGQTTILKFLGHNWKQWMVQEALKILDSEKKGLIDRKAIESVGKIDRASAFRQSVENYKVPKTTQKKIAEKIIKEKIPTKRIPLVVRQSLEKEPKDDPAILKLQNLITAIDDQSRSLLHKIMELRRNMDLLNIQQIKGIKASLAASSLKRLFKEMERLKERDSDEADS